MVTRTSARACCRLRQSSTSFPAFSAASNSRSVALTFSRSASLRSDQGWRNKSESPGALHRNRVAASFGSEWRNQRNTHHRRQKPQPGSSPLQLTHLARHILNKVFSRFLPRKTIRKLGMKTSELLSELVNVLFANEQFGDGKGPILNAVFRYHFLTPPNAFIKM